MSARNVVGGICATFGLLIVLIQVGLHFGAALGAIDHYDINEVVLSIATILAIGGAYVIDPRKAKGFVEVVVTTAERLGSVRFGRRKTDPIGVPTHDTHPVVPMTPMSDVQLPPPEDR
jgi:hypothetical protein